MDQTQAAYGEPASVQESMGVLLEEFHELREAVHSNKSESIRMEAVQVAAVALRLAEAIEHASPSFMVRSGLR